MRKNPVEMLTIVNPRSSDRVIGEALSKGEAKKLAAWWNENYQPAGQHVHHFLRLNKVYSRGGKKRYDVVREVVERNPESGWTRERWRNYVLGAVVVGVGYGLYRDRMAQARNGAEAASHSFWFFAFGAAAAFGLYRLFGEKKERALEQNRKVDRFEISWSTGTIGGGHAWFAYIGDELIGEISEYVGEEGYRYRLANEWYWTPADDWGEAEEGLIADYNLARYEELEELEENPRRNQSAADLEWTEVELGGVVQWHASLKNGVQVGRVTTFPDEPGYQYQVEGRNVWYRARTFEQAKEDLFEKFMEEHVTGPDPWEWDGILPDWWPMDENPGSRQKYFVRIPKEGVSYPKPGSEYYPKGYPLKKAQDFARIGSQTGGAREVRRGRGGGPRVRTYKKGKRTWPMTRGQAKNLLPAEVPKRLRAS